MTLNVCLPALHQGEHGTGRNMAPFVELEWGSRAMSYMKRIKGIFDPHNLLNPGVIINEVCFLRWLYIICFCSMRK